MTDQVCDIGTLCRLCSRSTSVLPISIIDRANPHYLREIVTSLQLEINNENGFPTVMCFSCSLVVKNWITLRQKTYGAHKFFCDLLKVPETCGLSKKLVPSSNVKIVKMKRNTLDQTSKSSKSEKQTSSNVITPSDDYSAMNILPHQSDDKVPNLVETTSITANKLKVENSSNNIKLSNNEEISKSQETDIQPMIQENCEVIPKHREIETVDMKQELNEDDNGQFVIDSTTSPIDQVDSCDAYNASQIMENVPNKSAVAQFFIDSETNPIDQIDDKDTSKTMEKVPRRTWRKFVCHMCPGKFPSKRSLQLHHKANHHEYYVNYLLQCFSCKDKFETEYLLDTHIKYRHPDWLKAEEEEEEARLARQEKNSTILTKVNPPPIANTAPSAKRVAKTRNKKGTNKKEEKIKCPLCEGKYLERYIGGHLKTKHNIIPKEVSKYYKPTCNHCGESFRNKIELEKHAITHTLPYFCTLCKKRFNQYGYENHIHGKNYFISSEIKYICDFCNREVATRNNMQRHIREQHFGVLTDFQCKYCNTKFRTKFGINNHNKKVHKHTSKPLFSCRHCTSQFEDPAKLQIHEIKNHPSMMPFCEICLTVFPKNQYLLKHLQEKHKKAKSLVCNICHNTLRSMRNLLRHKQLHNNYKIPSPWECKICQKVFSSKKNLAIHQNRHNQIPSVLLSWNCNVCEKIFSSRSYLLQHKKSHSELSGTWECDNCNMCFSSKHEFIQHQNTHSKNQCEVKSEICFEEVAIKQEKFDSMSEEKEEEGGNSSCFAQLDQSESNVVIKEEPTYDSDDLCTSDN